MFKYFAFLLLSLISTQSILSSAFAKPPCASCGNHSELHCPRCKIPYCGKDCQKTDWKNHKLECGPIRALIGKAKTQQSTIPGAGKGLFASQRYEAQTQVAIYYGTPVGPSFLDSIQVLTSKFLQATETGRMDGWSDTEMPGHLAAQIANDGLMSPEMYRDLMSFDCNNLTDDQVNKIKGVARNYTLAYLDPDYNKPTHNQRPSNIVITELKIASRVGQEVKIDKLRYDFYKTTKRVEAGEELLNSYGPGYWLEIPGQMCLRKGRPLESLRLNRAISEEFEDLRDTQPAISNFIKQHGMSEVLSIYGSKLNFESASLDTEKHLLMTRLSSLFSPLNYLEAHIRDEAEFNTMKDTLNLESELDRIASLPHEEFIDEHFSS